MLYSGLLFGSKASLFSLRSGVSVAAGIKMYLLHFV